MSKRSWRARISASDSVLLWFALAVASGVMAQMTRRGRWHVRRGRALDRLQRRDAATRAYLRALSRGDQDPAGLLRLGDQLEQRGSWGGALEAFERGWAAGDDRVARKARSRLVALHDRAGHWDRARRVLEEHVASEPEDAAGHRRLAKVMSQMGHWHGFFEPEGDGGGPGWFQPLPVTASAELLEVARYRLELALALEPTRRAWRAELAPLCEATGDLDGAVECYRELLERARGSHRSAAFKDRHRWEFALERARYLAGEPRVEDPLFACGLRVDPADEIVPAQHPAGCFDAHWTFGGLGVRGLVTGDVDEVELLLDDVVLRTTNVAPGTGLRKFGQAIGRDVLEHFPTSGRLRVRTLEGAELLAAGRASGVRVSVPHGDGNLAALLEQGARVDKKGLLSPPPEEVRERQQAYLRLYEKVRVSFDELLDTSLFLIHGTLLGHHRDGDLIPGDDDFDVAYVSAQSDPAAVKAEALEYVAALVRAGYTVSFNRSGRLFRVHGRGEAEGDLHLDVHPVWFSNGRAWLHNDVCIPAQPDDFLPAREEDLRGRRVLVPQRAEVFLEGQYGPGWRVPDPGYMNHPAGVPPDVSTTLSRALMTPREYRDVAARLENEAGERSGMGRFVSIGSRSLYPLEDFVP